MKSKLVAALALVLTVVAAPSVSAVTTIVGVFSSMSTTLDHKLFVLTPPPSNSPGAWSFTIADSTIATVSGNVATLIGVGATQVTATQAASGVYTQTVRSTQLYVGQGVTTLGAFPAQSVQYGSKTFTIIPPTSNSSGTWSYISSDPTIATVTGNVATFVDAGSVTLSAVQAASTNWSGATASMKLTIVAPIQTIGTFGNLSLTRDSVSSVGLMAPTSTSTGGWTFTSSNPAVASMSGNLLTPTGLGTAVITARQAPTAVYGSIKTSMTVTITAAIPTIGTFADREISMPTSTPFTGTIAAPTSSSNGAWTFTSSDPTIASIVGSTITYLKPGKVTISANQAAAGNYGAYGPIHMILTIKGTPVLSALPDLQKVVGDSDFSLPIPTSLSTGAITYVSSDPAVITITGNIVKVVGAGSAVVTVSQAPIDSWSGASTSFKVNILGTTPTLGTFAPMSISVGETKEIVPPTSNSSGKWTFTSPLNSVANISGTKITGVGPGTVLITALQSPAGAYGLSNTVTMAVTVKAKAIVGKFTNLKLVFGGLAPSIVPPASTSKGSWSYISSNASVINFLGANIQLLGVGTATITATQAATDTYPANSQTFTIEVTAAKIIKGITATVVLGTKAITIKVVNGKATATIDGKVAKIGKNVVKVGQHYVVVKSGTKVLYKKVVVVH